MDRTHTNGELSLKNINENVILLGWVHKKRNFGPLVFIDLRDRYGVTQIVFNENMASNASSIKNEYVIKIEGTVVQRSSPNKDLATGEIEVNATKVTIINEAELTPLIIADKTDALEDTRMKYRYLDLRRPIMQQMLITRHRITRHISNFFDSRNFISIETPIIAKSTPEGARDYLVPSRVHKGKFYALPQSPQIFKQLFMIAGLDRYYQIARCFRDEDLRADRQMEFTQIDVEMSFATTADIYTLIEDLFVSLVKEIKDIKIETPFLRLTYSEAMNKYGTDKPDLRFSLPLTDITSIFKDSSFVAFNNQESIKCLVLSGATKFSRKDIDALGEVAKKYHAKGLAHLKFISGKLDGAITKFLSEAVQASLVQQLQLREDDLILIVADKWNNVCTSLGAVRSAVANKLNLIDENDLKFCFITDWPLLEYDEDNKRYVSMSHPFTRPQKESADKLYTNPLEVLADAYDVVLNGYELGSGSLRIYDVKMQNKVFELLGLSQKEVEERFGFFTSAFKYGTPPHGGFALGLDRIVMILNKATSLRDVVAFPKNINAVCPMMETPTEVEQSQLDELGIKAK